MTQVGKDEFAHARNNAHGWLASIEEMLAELKDWQGAAEAERWTGPHKDKYGTLYFDCTDGTWTCAGWQALCKAHDIEAEDKTGDAYDQARQVIEESVLSVQVRDGWHFPGAPSEDGPEEYEILLTTGGPALRIWGELDAYNQPKSAELQMQDWFLPWTRYDAPEATLLAFASIFYFGD